MFLTLLGRHQRASNCCFQMEIGPAIFDAAEAYAKSLGVPNISVAISCDDTKLHPALRTYWDAEKQHHILLGAVQGPMVVASPDELIEVLHSMEDNPKAKATKVYLRAQVHLPHETDFRHVQLRLWCMQIPQPHIPPIILLGMAIPDNLDAPVLTGYSHQIIDGLSKRGIHVVSYSCDGTETERSVQRLLILRSERKVTYTIPHPTPALPALTLNLPVFGDRPTVMVQDNKHGLKTA